MDFELTDDEIAAITVKYFGGRTVLLEPFKEVAESAQRKLVEWLIKQDEGESHKLGKWSRIIYVNENEWQELRRSVGL